MPVSIRQIADHAGVSVATASHILGGRNSAYRACTRERVRRAAQELGYRPNASARAVRSGRFGAIALLLSTKPHRSSLFNSLLEGIHDSLTPHDLHLTLAELPDDKLTNEGYVPKILREWLADGLLINYTDHIPDQMVKLITKNHLPSVWINSKQRHDCVYPDDASGGRIATQRLQELGHRKIAYANYSVGHCDSDSHYSIADRQHGYEQAMREAGLQPQVISSAGAVPRDQRVAFSRSWLQADQPTAVIGYGPTTIWPIIHAAVTELGWSVPHDLSVVTFSEAMVNETGIEIDTVTLPEYTLGESAVQMLIKKIDRPKEPQDPQAVPLGLEVGQSCVSPSRS